MVKLSILELLYTWPWPSQWMHALWRENPFSYLTIGQGVTLSWGKPVSLALFPDVQCKWLDPPPWCYYTCDHELANEWARCGRKNIQFTRNNWFFNKIKAFISISNICWTTHSGCVLPLTMYERYAEAFSSVRMLSEFPLTTLIYIFKNTLSFFLS